MLSIDRIRWDREWWIEYSFWQKKSCFLHQDRISIRCQQNTRVRRPIIPKIGFHSSLQKNTGIRRKWKQYSGWKFSETFSMLFQWVSSWNHKHFYGIHWKKCENFHTRYSLYKIVGIDPFLARFFDLECIYPLQRRFIDRTILWSIVFCFCFFFFI